VPFMNAVFTEPDSAEVIEEMIAIGLDASPDVVAAQELELDWVTPARLLGRIECPTLIVHGEGDVPLPVETARAIAGELPNAQLMVIPGAGHRPDIRSPVLVNPILLEFLLGASSGGALAAAAGKCVSHLGR
jgi:pimeloyl-ACP methyl ester carboxylesterase